MHSLRATEQQQFQRNSLPASSQLTGCSVSAISGSWNPTSVEWRLSRRAIMSGFEFGLQRVRIYKAQLLHVQMNTQGESCPAGITVSSSLRVRRNPVSDPHEALVPFSWS
jgi:hypothetical protein